MLWSSITQPELVGLENETLKKKRGKFQALISLNHSDVAFYLTRTRCSLDLLASLGILENVEAIAVEHRHRLVNICNKILVFVLLAPS
jgi:hypothetical protein